MSRMISNDQRSPSISIDAFRGHPDRRAGPGFFLATFLSYHITCILQVIYAYCFCNGFSITNQSKGAGMQLNPHLHFNGQCEAAFKFYEKCLGGKIEAMMTH